jgi:SUMO ligase MMS21 Smc5/6 complex component
MTHETFILMANNRAIKKQNMKCKLFHTINNPINDICPISLNKFNTNDTIIILKCNHLFHKSYIEQWVSKHMDCPICRYSFC